LCDSNFCYWHHKARARRRRHERIGGPISMQANSGLELPLLEDANAIQVTIQEIMQAILDRRIDNKRAGLLLYSLQLASSNIRNLTPLPADDGGRIGKIGCDDQDVFNDCIGDDDRDEVCDGDCSDCANNDCEARTDEESEGAAEEDSDDVTEEDGDGQTEEVAEEPIPEIEPASIPRIKPSPIPPSSLPSHRIPKLKPCSVASPNKPPRVAVASTRG
jgi:hypothetical protein